VWNVGFVGLGVGAIDTVVAVVYVFVGVVEMILGVTG